MKQLLELGSKSCESTNRHSFRQNVQRVQRPFCALDFCSPRLGFPSTVAKQAANQCSSAGSPRAELLRLFMFCQLCHVKSCQGLVYVCYVLIFTDAFGFAALLINISTFSSLSYVVHFITPMVCNCQFVFEVESAVSWLAENGKLC